MLMLLRWSRSPSILALVQSVPTTDWKREHRRATPVLRSLLSRTPGSACLLPEQSVSGRGDAFVRSVGYAPLLLLQELRDHLRDGYRSDRLSTVGFAFQFYELLQRQFQGVVQTVWSW